MKKILLIGSALFVWGSYFSQIDNKENNSKNLRFGLKTNLSIDWLRPENKKKFKSNGSSLGYGWGAQIEYRLNKTASIVTGVGLQTSYGKIGFFDASSKDTVLYLLNKDEEFKEFNEKNRLDSNNSLYQLFDRKYKINYVTIPIALKMKTKEIGYFTYYGTFGLNLGIKTKATVKDEVMLTNSNNKSTINDLNLNSGVSFARTGLIVGGGAEYTVSGSTAVFIDLTYNYFFTNVLDKDDEYLGVKNYTSNTGFNPIKQKAIPGNIALTIGVLF